MRLQSSWPKVLSLAAHRQPPWLVLEAILAFCIIGILLAHQIAPGRAFFQQGRYHIVLSQFHQARLIIEGYWSFYGRFPEDVFAAADDRTIRTFLGPDLLAPGKNTARFGSARYQLSYLPSGRLIFTPLEPNTNFPEQIDFIPTIVGEVGAQRLHWQCVAAAVKLPSTGLVTPYPDWCQPQPINESVL